MSLTFTREQATDAVQQALVLMIGSRVDEIKPEKSFADLGADSLDQVEIIMFIEDHLNITIHDPDAEKLTTVGQAIDFLQRPEGHEPYDGYRG